MRPTGHLQSKVKAAGTVPASRALSLPNSQSSPETRLRALGGHRSHPDIAPCIQLGRIRLRLRRDASCRSQVVDSPIRVGPGDADSTQEAADPGSRPGPSLVQTSWRYGFHHEHSHTRTTLSSRGPVAKRDPESTPKTPESPESANCQSKVLRWRKLAFIRNGGTKRED